MGLGQQTNVAGSIEYFCCQDMLPQRPISPHKIQHYYQSKILPSQIALHAGAYDEMSSFEASFDP